MSELTDEHVAHLATITDGKGIRRIEVTAGILAREVQAWRARFGSLEYAHLHAIVGQFAELQTLRALIPEVIEQLETIPTDMSALGRFLPTEIQHELDAIIAKLREALS